MDNQYRIVRSVQPGGGMAGSDMHEFILINEGKSALLTVYQQRQYDMSYWNVTSGIGYIVESVFQEVDVETSKVIFEWRSLDHVNPKMSYTLPATTDTSGDGLNPHTPWDYFHINSIDKNEDGDYLISARHTSCIYKLSGKDGSIIWMLNGETPTFRNTNFGFSQQHDARWMHENKTHTVLSLYNNGSNGFNVTQPYSAGMIIEIDHTAMTATKIREYAPPGKSMSSSSQGNLQLLPNKNVVMGWGNNAYVSEHDEEGNVLFWGWLSTGRMMNYRAQKYEWIGEPTDIPALWTYANSEEHESQLTLYVSWNGATRVAKWKFYCSEKPDGPFTTFEPIPKQGFETTVVHPSYFPWCYVAALDKDGTELANSTVERTFVPSPKLRINCVDAVCGNAQQDELLGEDDSYEDPFFTPSPSPEDEEEGALSPPPPPPPVPGQDLNDHPPEQNPPDGAAPPEPNPPAPPDVDQNQIPPPPPPPPQDNHDSDNVPSEEEAAALEDAPVPAEGGGYPSFKQDDGDSSTGSDADSSSFQQYGGDVDDDQQKHSTDSILSLTDWLWWILSGIVVCAALAGIYVWRRRRRNYRAHDSGSGGGGGGASFAADHDRYREHGEAEEMEGLVNGGTALGGKTGFFSAADSWMDGRWPWTWMRGRRQNSQSYFPLPDRQIEDRREAFD